MIINLYDMQLFALDLLTKWKTITSEKFKMNPEKKTDDKKTFGFLFAWWKNTKWNDIRTTHHACYCIHILTWNESLMKILIFSKYKVLH